VYLTIYSVPSAERHSVESALVTDGLSRLIRWLRSAESETETWREIPHSYTLAFDKGKLVEEERAGVGIRKL